MSNDSPPPDGPSPYGAPEPGSTPGQTPGSVPVSVRRDNPKALWSLILGIISVPITCLCGFGLLIGIPAVYLGWQAKNQPTGRGMAMSGLVLGAVAIVLGVVWLVLLASGAVDTPEN
jgi:apolipoprotein N-acyltransferase